MARIQLRRGNRGNLPSSGLLPGEPLITLDRGALYVATSSSGTIPVVPPVDELPEIVSVDDAADFLLIYDASEGREKKVKVSDIGSGPSHDPVTVTDSATIDFTLAGQDITAGVKPSSLDSTYFSLAVNSALSLASSSLQPGDNVSSLVNDAGYLTTIPSHSHTASDISDFDTEVSNNADVSANTSARHSHSNLALLETYNQSNANLADAVAKKHDAVTVLDSTEIDFTLSGQQITASLKTGISATKIGGGNVSSTEFDYLDGVTSAIQTQLNNRPTGSGTSNQIAYWSGTSTLAALSTVTYPSLTELSYVKGVTSAIQTQINGKQTADATLTSLAAIAGVSGDLIYANGADSWTRLPKGTDGQYLKLVGGFPAWAAGGGGGTPGGSDRELQINNSGAFGGGGWYVDASDGRLYSTSSRYIGSQTYPIISAYVSGIAEDFIPVVGSGAHTKLIGSRGNLTHKNGCLGNIDGGNSFSLTYGRLRFDNLEMSQKTLVIDQLNIAGSAVFEGNDSDRNRTFLINRYGYTNHGGSTSAVLHWGAYYTSGSEPYIEHHYRSDWELGNDYWQGVNPDDFVTNKWWETGGHNFYLWDSVNAIPKLLITNSLIESYVYDSLLANPYRMFALKNYDGGTNSIYLGRNAGNYFGDTSYGGSICIGPDAGYNKNTAGNNILIGYGAGGTQTNGSNLLCLGTGAGGAIDGDYNTCLGHYCASAGGAYNYSTQGLYVGNFINAGFGQYRIIIDTSGGTHNTFLKSSRHSLIFGTCSPSTPQNNALSLNANVAVQGLNMLIDDDGNPVVDDSGEVLFLEAA